MILRASSARLLANDDSSSIGIGAIFVFSLLLFTLLVQIQHQHVSNANGQLVVNGRPRDKSNFIPHHNLFFSPQTQRTRTILVQHYYRSPRLIEDNNEIYQ